nr:UMP-CMP kinase [Loxodonta africana]
MLVITSRPYGETPGKERRPFLLPPLRENQEDEIPLTAIPAEAELAPRVLSGQKCDPSGAEAVATRTVAATSRPTSQSTPRTVSSWANPKSLRRTERATDAPGSGPENLNAAFWPTVLSSGVGWVLRTRSENASWRADKRVGEEPGSARSRGHRSRIGGLRRLEAGGLETVPKLCLSGQGKAAFVHCLFLEASAPLSNIKKYGYTHLSAGELLRDERKNPDSQYGELIEKYIKDGKIVPVEITISLLKREMDQTMAADAQKNKFLIDGFPRNQDNLQGWNKTMDGKADVSFVLFFDCNNEICIERCLERGKSSGRTDDNRESLEKRIQTYLQSTKPIIDLYEEMGKVRKIDASKSVDEVFGEVVKIFDKEG